MFSSGSDDDDALSGESTREAVESKPGRRPPAARPAPEPGPGPDPDDVPAVDVSEMTPVARIRAMREGRLEFPGINAENPVSRDDSADESDSDDSVHVSDGAPVWGEDGAGDRGVDSGHDLSGFTDSLTAPVSGRDRVLSLFQRARSGAKRKPLVAAVAGLTVAGAVLYISGVGRSSDNADEPVVASGTDSSSTSSPSSPAVVPIVNGPIKPESAETSIEMCGDGSTAPMDGFSRDSSNAWLCQTPFGFIPGIKMTITLPSMTALTEFSAVPGFNGRGADKKDNWPRYSLVSAVMLYFDDGTSKRLEFTPDRKSQSVQIGTVDKPVYTRTVVLTVQAIKAPPADSGGSAPTSGAPSGGGGIFGDLGQWGERLGGSGPSAPSGPSTATGAAQAAASSFAMSGMVLTGHAVR